MFHRSYFFKLFYDPDHWPAYATPLGEEINEWTEEAGAPNGWTAMLAVAVQTPSAEATVSSVWSGQPHVLSAWAPELAAAGQVSAEPRVVSEWASEGAATSTWAPEGSIPGSVSAEAPLTSSWTEEGTP